MIDDGMLELIGRPGGYSFAGPEGAELPPKLEEVFARIVRDGWAPRNIAYGAELERLEVATTRGKCLEPLIVEGDQVFIDRHASPLPGDIVSFALSERAAAGQNENLPSFDARPCKPGDQWLKLFAPYGGMGMLFERYGHAMSATWATCESPDDRPALFPVRNILRNGRLLFAPDAAHASQLGGEAASSIASAFYTGNLTVNSNLGTGPVDQDLLTCHGIFTGSPVAVEVATSISLSGGGAPASSFAAADLDIWMDGASIGSMHWSGANLGNYGGGASPPVQQVTFTGMCQPPAGGHTFALHAHVAGSGSVYSVIMEADHPFIQIREYKR